MKSIKQLVVILIVFLTGACSESFLDTRDLTKKNLETYYTTPADAQEALVGCYDALQSIYSEGGIGGLPVASDVMSDLCFGGTGYTDGDNFKMIDEFDKSVGSAQDQNLYEANWIAYYKGVFRANTLIGKLDNIEWGKEAALRNGIESEARFLRAYFYFDMVRLWGRVPLLTEPSAEIIPQSEPDEIYALVAEDLLFAVAHGSTQTNSQIAPTEYGHATKWSAEALLARVYLYYTGYYGKNNLLDKVTQADALGFVEDVIANSGYDLVDNFADLWPAAATYEAAKAGKPISQNTYAGETNKEVVFAIKYTYTSDFSGNLDGNHWMVLNGIRKLDIPEKGYGFGWGACTVRPDVYADWDTSDTRREASIMAITEEGINYTQIEDMKEYTGYFTKKYIPICDSAGISPTVGYGAANFMIGQFQDYFVIRFADVLLMAAELGSVNALDYVNRVRFRAKVDLVPNVDKDIIFEERRLEFAFEGLRYWDLLRYDNTLQYAANKISYSGTVKNGGIDADKTISGSNLLVTHGLSQIPYNQITLTGGIYEQNPGW